MSRKAYYLEEGESEVILRGHIVSRIDRFLMNSLEGTGIGRSALIQAMLNRTEDMLSNDLEVARDFVKEATEIEANLPPSGRNAPARPWLLTEDGKSLLDRFEVRVNSIALGNMRDALEPTIIKAHVSDELKAHLIEALELGVNCPDDEAQHIVISVNSIRRSE